MSASARPATILVVDDNRAVRSLIRRILAMRGYGIFEAGSADEAFALLDSAGASIDLLITDLVLPGMDGVRLSEHVRRRFPDVFVILISGRLDLSETATGRPPRSILLRKPFSPDQILDAVTRALAPAS